MKPVIGTALGMGLLLAGTSVLVHDAAAQDYPTEPVRIIVPYAPGGGTDVFARRLAERLGERLGQQFVVENRGGAGGSIGMQEAAAAEADGYTLVFALNAQYAVNVSLYDDLPYDPLEDFDVITILGAAPYVLVVHPDLPIHSLEEFVAYAEENPDELNYASAGIGSGAHLSMELLRALTGTDLVHVPYTGAGAAYPDLLAGRVDTMFSTYAPITGHLEDGGLRALGVTTPTRSDALPDLPAIGEVVDGYDSGVWYGFAAPAGTPDDVLDILNATTLDILADEEFRAILVGDAIQPWGATRTEAEEYMADEIVKWAEVVEASGATVD